VSGFLCYQIKWLWCRVLSRLMLKRGMRCAMIAGGRGSIGLCPDTSNAIEAIHVVAGPRVNGELIATEWIGARAHHATFALPRAAGHAGSAAGGRRRRRGPRRRWIPRSAHVVRPSPDGSDMPCPTVFSAVRRMTRAAATSRSWTVPYVEQVHRRRSSDRRATVVPSSGHTSVERSNRPCLTSVRPCQAVL